MRDRYSRGASHYEGGQAAGNTGTDFGEFVGAKAKAPGGTIDN